MSPQHDNKPPIVRYTHVLGTEIVYPNDSFHPGFSDGSVAEKPKSDQLDERIDPLPPSAGRLAITSTPGRTPEASVNAPNTQGQPNGDQQWPITRRFGEGTDYSVSPVAGPPPIDLPPPYTIPKR